jgi:hypothetical protein
MTKERQASPLPGRGKIFKFLNSLKHCGIQLNNNWRTMGEKEMKRTNVVKLIVDKDAHGLLKELGVATAKCWNEVNWLRMQ